MNYNWMIYAPEVVDAGAEDWRNVLGSGPFMLTNYVEGAYVEYEKNPVYWGTTTINGEEYPTPFVDKLVFPLTQDESTRLAALRTAEVDYMRDIPLKHQDSLADSSPELIFKRFMPCDFKIALPVPAAPFSDINVRRAMWIGTDRQAILDAVYEGDGELHVFPAQPGLVGIYTPIEELPADLQILFDYDPALARQMIIDAGYPEGFEMELAYEAGMEEADALGEILVDQWADINVTLTLNPMEVGAFWGYMLDPTWTKAVMYPWGNDTAYDVPFNLLTRTAECCSFSGWSSEEYDEMYWASTQILDNTERTAMIKELDILGLAGASHLGLPMGYMVSGYWPWLKNYYGEQNAGHFDPIPMIQRLWIDQDLKADILD